MMSQNLSLSETAILAGVEVGVGVEVDKMLPASRGEHGQVKVRRTKWGEM